MLARTIGSALSTKTSLKLPVFKIKSKRIIVKKSEIWIHGGLNARNSLLGVW